MSIKCIIIEDEPLASEKLENFASKLPFLEVVKVFRNGISALNFLNSEKIDLIFLDIEMEILDGITLLETTNISSYVIITTAYDQYAIKSYELNVTDYLLKPYSFERFLQAVNKVNELITTNEDNNKLSSSDPKSVFIKTEYRIEKVELDDILYIEGMKDYLCVRTSKNKIMTLQKFKAFEDFLPKPNFIRIHRSYLVSLDKIQSIERNRIKIGDKLIPVSKTYKDEFYKILEENGMIL